MLDMEDQGRQALSISQLQTHPQGYPHQMIGIAPAREARPPLPTSPSGAREDG